MSIDWVNRVCTKIGEIKVEKQVWKWDSLWIESANVFGMDKIEIKYDNRYNLIILGGVVPLLISSFVLDRTNLILGCRDIYFQTFFFWIFFKGLFGWWEIKKREKDKR